MEITPIYEDELEHLVTPFFMHMNIENVPQSEIQRRPVMEIKEVVQLRFAGDQKYSPVLGVDEMYRREGHNIITYAERFADQYRQFQMNADQVAAGTPLDMLASYGITPAQLSLCRTAKVYSIEALHALEKPGLNTLGQAANSLKDMARVYMADRAAGAQSDARIRELEEQVAMLRSANPLPVNDPSPDEIAAARAVADDEFEAMTDAQLKQIIKDKTGQAPRGTPSRDFLLSTVRELAA